MPQETASGLRLYGRLRGLSCAWTARRDERQFKQTSLVAPQCAFLIENSRYSETELKSTYLLRYKLRSRTTGTNDFSLLIRGIRLRSSMFIN